MNRENAIKKYDDYLKNFLSDDYRRKTFIADIVTAIDSKNVITLRHWMNGVNPKINRLFSALTLLPAKTQKEVDNSLMLLNPEQWELRSKQKNERIEKLKKEKYERELDKTLSKKIKFNDRVITMREFYGEIISLGFNQIESYQAGAMKKYRIRNEKEFSYYNINKKNEADYVKSILEGGNS